MKRQHKRKIHLAQFLVHGPTYHSLAMWRHPLTNYAGYRWDRPELYQHIARLCERGRFDMVFFTVCAFVGLDTLGTVASNGPQGFLWLVVLAVVFVLPYALLMAEVGSSFSSLQRFGMSRMPLSTAILNIVWPS